MHGGLAAERARPIPTAMFGLQLEQSYDIGNKRRGQKGDVPVKHFTIVQNCFEPQQTYIEFPDVEDAKIKTDRYFGSSIRAYIILVNK